MRDWEAPSPPRMPDRIESNARTVMVLTAFSRITGLVRDGVLSRVLGANQLTMPRSGSHSSFRTCSDDSSGKEPDGGVPAGVREAADRDPDRAAQLATMVIACLMIGLGGVVVLGRILFLISAMRNHDDIAIQLMMITLAVHAAGLSGRDPGRQQGDGRFDLRPPSILLNGAIIVAVTTMAWTTVDDERARLLSVVKAAVAMVAAGLLQAVWMLWSLRGRAGWNWNPESAMKPLKQVWRASLPMILASASCKLNTFFDGLIASYPAVMGTTDFLGATYPLDDGAMTIISYAQRLYQFPLGVFAISVATAIYPVLARQADDDVPFADTIRRGLRSSCSSECPPAWDWPWSGNRSPRASCRAASSPRTTPTASPPSCSATRRRSGPIR